MTRSRAGGSYLVLALGVAVVSTASILIRYAQAEGVPSLTIAAVRLGLAAVILTPIVWVRASHELRALRGRDLVLALLSGVALAIHFWSWIASLAYTSVASSTVLVTTNPLWVGLASLLILGERPGRWTTAGIALTLAGSLFIFASDGSQGGTALQPDPIRGNLLALSGALAASAYLLLGRALRSRVGLLVYIWLAYGTAALVLLLTVGLTGHTLAGYSTFAYVVMMALALGPQLLGHTAFNWALRHVSATFVAISILGEPIGSALLALLLLGERFAPLQLAGFVSILGGIYLAARGEGGSGGTRWQRWFSKDRDNVDKQGRPQSEDPSASHDPRIPEAVYAALTNARLHAAFTGASATGRARVGYRFTAWDGYIEGRHIVLRRGRLIVQEWSTSDWPKSCSPSRLEFRLKRAKTGTELVMVQSGVPASQSRSLRSGWTDYYWKPLRAWFAKR